MADSTPNTPDRPLDGGGTEERSASEAECGPTGADTGAGLVQDALAILASEQDTSASRARESGSRGSVSGGPISEALRAQALAAFDASLPEVVSEAESAEGPKVFAEEAFAEEALGDALLLEALAAAPAEGLSLGVRHAALACFEPAAEFASDSTPARQATVRERPLQGRQLKPLFGARGLAVAALLLLGVGIAFLVTGEGEEAYAGLELRALARADTAGAVQTSRVEPGYRAAFGRRFTPSEDELLSFRYAHDAMLVVGAGDAVRVSRTALVDAKALRPGVTRARGVPMHLLRLESGEAQLATREHPIPLEIDGIGVLVLESGAAHVAVDAGDGAHAPAVALHAHSAARFYRADGSASVPLVGPARVLLAADGIKAFGAPARGLFHDLRFFGGSLPATTTERAVSARLFRARATTGAVRRGRQDVRVLARRGEAADVQLTWTPEPAVGTAYALKVALRAPAGTRVSLAQVADVEGEAEHAAVPLATATVVHTDGVPTDGMPTDGAGEPGLAVVTLALPRDWLDRLPGGRVELRLACPAAPRPASAQPTTTPAKADRAVIAWFDGIALVFGPEPEGRDRRQAH